MNFKFLLTIAFVALSAFDSTANASDNLLQLHYIDGTVAHVSLSDHPVITFTENEINIRTTTTTLSVSSDDISRFSYVIADASGIKTVELNKNIIILSDNELIYDFGSCGGIIALYDLQGRTVRSRHFAAGVGKLSIVGIAPGTYIAKANSSTFKFRVNE